MKEPTAEKKTYQPPQLETEEVFETFALACCKVEEVSCGEIVIGTPNVQANAS